MGISISTLLWGEKRENILPSYIRVPCYHEVSNSKPDLLQHLVVSKPGTFYNNQQGKVKMKENINITQIENIDGDGHPIPSELVDRIDVIAVANNGDVRLRIVSVGYLDGSSYTEERIIYKINTYLGFINSKYFEDEFGKPSFEKTSIVLTCTHEPHENVSNLLQEIKGQVKIHNASLSTEISG